jgi:hypothetical protein
MPTHLTQIEEKLRRAAEGRHYAEVERLALELSQAVREYAAGFPPGDERGARALGEFLDLISWALILMQSARSSCLAQLRMVTTAQRYAQQRGPAARESAILLNG